MEPLSEDEEGCLFGFVRVLADRFSEIRGSC